MRDVTFLNPEFFWLLLLIPIAAAWHIYKLRSRRASLKMSTFDGFKGHKSFWAMLEPWLIVLRLAAMALLVVALARPRTVAISSHTKMTRGIDIVMAIDVSASMLARDLKPNRLSALRDVAANFAKNRPNDRIGLVFYAGEAYTKTPVTSDKGIIINAMRDIRYDKYLQDGTAIGMGLATAVNRLKDSKAKSKVIILLTDGVNNSGTIEPETASDIAKEFGIKVYTIGIGRNGLAEFPYAETRNGQFLYRQMEVKIDEQLMKDIAAKTDGKYFRATSNTRLNAIYDEINKLETTEIEELKFYDYDEKFRPFAIAAALLVLLELLLRNTVYRSFI